jgi:hypothetical protein
MLFIKENLQVRVLPPNYRASKVHLIAKFIAPQNETREFIVAVHRTEKFIAAVHASVLLARN